MWLAEFLVSRGQFLSELFRCSSQLPPSGIILLYILYIVIKGKIVSRRENPEVSNRDPGEEDKQNQQMFAHEKGETMKDSDSSDVSSLALSF